MRLSDSRERLLGWTLALAVAGFGGWWMLDYLPRVRELSAEIEALREQQLRNRDARLQIVRLGLPGMEQATLRMRAELSALEDRVPTRRDGLATTGELTRAVTEIATRHRVRVHTLHPAPPLEEEPFHLEGVQVLAAARYHEIGAFLTDLLALPRTTQIRGSRLDVAPDSLLRTVRRSAALPASGPHHQVPAPELPPGETPFTVVARFTLYWFSLPPDSTAGGVASPPNAS